MSEVTLITGEADAGLRERLEKETSVFNAAAIGHDDARLLSIATPGKVLAEFAWHYNGHRPHQSLR